MTLKLKNIKKIKYIEKQKKIKQSYFINRVKDVKEGFNH